jgi:hypothetical protein
MLPRSQYSMNKWRQAAPAAAPAGELICVAAATECGTCVGLPNNIVDFDMLQQACRSYDRPRPVAVITRTAVVQMAPAKGIPQVCRRYWRY